MVFHEIWLYCNTVGDSDGINTTNGKRYFSCNRPQAVFVEINRVTLTVPMKVDNTSSLAMKLMFSWYYCCSLDHGAERIIKGTIQCTEPLPVLTHHQQKFIELHCQAPSIKRAA